MVVSSIVVKGRLVQNGTTMNATPILEVVVDENELKSWKSEGCLVKRALFDSAEVDALRRRFDELAASGQPIPGHWEPDPGPDVARDPLKSFPRVMHPHRFDALSKRMMLHPRVGAVLERLYGCRAIATQSMFYFKPPGSRGQALHQDNFYLKVRPDTCIAAWTAIDPAIPENGGLLVVPGTQDMEVVCPEIADESLSFTTHLVRVPAGMKAVPLELHPGDTLFFNGCLIHGSGPNRSKTMWRRSFICHYMPETSTHISKWYRPLFDFEGNEVLRQESGGGGPCGKEFTTPVFGA